MTDIFVVRWMICSSGSSVRMIFSLCRYFGWVHQVQAVLMKWNYKFKKEQIDYNEILTYIDQQSRLEHIGKTLCASSIIVDRQNAVTIKNKFLSTFEELNVLLIKYIPGKPDANWCTLPSLLQWQGVALPPHLLDLISQHVVFPGKEKVGKLLDPPPSSNTSGRFQPAHDVSLNLTKDFPLQKLSVLVKELKVFLLPIEDVLDMLVFFKLHPSEMFDKYLQVYLRKESEPSVREHHSSTNPRFTLPVFSAADMQPVSEDQSVVEGLSLHMLQRAMVQTREFIKKLMLGTAAYSEIIAKRQLDLEKLDLEQEFGTLHGFSAHFDPPVASFEGLAGVQSMLELFQYVHHIETIHNVCEQYKLQGCLDDPQLDELCWLAKVNRDQLTPVNASMKMKRVKEILYPDGKVSPHCIELFTALGNSTPFYQFVRDKWFAGNEGQAIFWQQCQLITAQLQHEEYNETVLNHLYAAFKIIEPFMDTHQKFCQLMLKVTSLDVSNGIKQLQTVNTNITLIQLWFSRAEVSEESTPHSCVQKRWCYMCKVYQAW